MQQSEKSKAKVAVSSGQRQSATEYRLRKKPMRLLGLIIYFSVCDETRVEYAARLTAFGVYRQLFLRRAIINLVRKNQHYGLPIRALILTTYFVISSKS